MAKAKTLEQKAIERAFAGFLSANFRNLALGLITPLNFVGFGDAEPDYAKAETRFRKGLALAREAHKFALTLAADDDKEAFQGAYADEIADLFTVVVGDLAPVSGTQPPPASPATPDAMKQMFRRGVEIARKAKALALAVAAEPGPREL